MPRMVHWTSFVDNGKEMGVLLATGYDSHVLDFAWDKYGDALIHSLSLLQRAVADSPEFIAAYFFLGLKYIHHYPRWNKSIPDVLLTKLTGRITVQKFYSKVVPTLMCLSRLVDEISWSDRLHPMNHGSHMFRER